MDFIVYAKFNIIQIMRFLRRLTRWAVRLFRAPNLGAFRLAGN